jgi:hypothetical protein
MNRFDIETLERRRLLAGNVTASVVDGSLVITGDSSANSILIQGELLDRNSLTITSPDGETLINGDTFPAGFSNITRHVIVRLRGGDDALEIRNVNFKNDLRADLGEGNDLLQTSNVLVRRNFSLHGAGGNDELLVTSMKVTGKTGLAAEEGGDILFIVGGAFGGHVRMLGGSGNDAMGRYSARFLDDPELISGPGADQVDEPGLTFHYDFNKGRQGWHSGFADWRKADKDLHHFVAEPAALPQEISKNKQGYLLSGDNRTDDLFMFLSKTLTSANGITTGQRYLTAFDIEFASNALTGGFGVGGSAGDSVYLKAGASATDVPSTALDEEGLYRLNLDHGQQASGGRDASLVGTIANGLTPDDVTDPDNAPYRTVHQIHVHPTILQTQPSQQVHLLIGTDSGFEATTSIYFMRVTVHLIPLQAAV